MSDERDEFHGVGGSYLLDPKTGKRTQTEAPTKPNPEGGARDKDGNLLNKAHDVLEPAFAAPAVAPVAEVVAKAPARLSRVPAAEPKGE